MNENKNDTAEGSKTKRPALLAAGGAGLGIAALAIGGTIAFWADEETTTAGFASGQFEIEVSTDGGESWQSGTTSEDYAVLDITDVVDAEGEQRFEQGEYVETYFQLRAAEGQSHDGVISAESVDVVFDVPDELDNHFQYYIESAPEQDGHLDIEGVIGSDGVFTDDGEIVVAADGTPLDFIVGLTASEDLPPDLEGEVAWTFTAELAE